MICIRNELSASVDESDGVITVYDTVTHTNTADVNATMVRHYRNVLATKKQMVRDALIALGWTPPPPFTGG